MRSAFPILLKIAILVVIYEFFLKHLDLNYFYQALQAINLNFLTLIGLIWFLQFALAAVRFKVLIEAFQLKLSFSSLLHSVTAGAFYSNVFATFVGGDLVRIGSLRRLKISKAFAAILILMDRFFGLLALTALCALSFDYVESANSFEYIVFTIVPLGSITIVLGSLILIVALKNSDLMNKVELFNAVKGIKFTRIIYLLMLSIVCQLTHVLIIYVISVALNANLGFFDSVLLTPQALFLALLPISFAGWGIRETSLVYFLKYAGVTEIQALTISIIYGITLIIYSSVCYAALMCAEWINDSNDLQKENI